MFDLSPEQLLSLMDPKNPKYLSELGGAGGLALKLATNVETGLAGDHKKRREFYGSNTLPEPISFSFLQFVWEALQDRTLNVLMVAAVVEVAIGLYKTIMDGEKTAIIDGAAIFAASILPLI